MLFPRGFALGRPRCRGRVAIVVSCLSFPPHQGTGCRLPSPLPKGRAGAVGAWGHCGGEVLGRGIPACPLPVRAALAPRYSGTEPPRSPLPSFSLAQPRPSPGPAHLPWDRFWVCGPRGRDTELLFSFRFEFCFPILPLLQRGVFIGDADPEPGIATVGMASSQPTSPSPLVHSLLPISFSLNSRLRPVLRAEGKKDADCQPCFWVRTAPDRTCWGPAASRRSGCPIPLCPWAQVTPCIRGRYNLSPSACYFQLVG